MTAKLSVIIPVHNGAKKIRKTAKQILEQDYENLELILVENGSSDRTWEICQALHNQDSRCKAYNSPVASILMARKIGIEHATGDYITFSDHDDHYRTKSSLSNMVKAIERTGADIVQFGYIYDLFGKKEQRIRVNEERTIDRAALINDYSAGIMGAYKQDIERPVWAKIYRSGVLKSIISDLDLIVFNGDDSYLNCCAFFSKETQRVSFIPICEYVYVGGVGVSGDGIKSVEDLFKSYEYLKTKAISLAKQNNVPDRSVYLSHRESLRFLDALIKSYIIRGDIKAAVCDKISEYWTYEFVKVAKEYFIEYKRINDLDEEMFRFSTETDPERYYNYCIQRMDNLKKQQIKYKVKYTLKTALRWLNKIW